MDFIKEAKETCPSCGNPNTKSGKMIEEGVSIPVSICSKCGWWG